MINLKTYEVLNTPTIEEGVKYLKTQFRENTDRFESRWITPLRRWIMMNNVKPVDSIINIYRELFNEITPYSYSDAFKIKNQDFRALVFSVINVPEMVKNLGHKRIKTEGITLINRTYNEVLGEFVEQEIQQVYELHKVNGEKLEVSEDLYAIKCWCTSTNNEHWLWTLENKDPLEAIANTCYVYKSMLGNIKHIIRQGDVYLFEMKDGKFITIDENEEAIPLDKETYFSLLKSQS